MGLGKVSTLGTGEIGSSSVQPGSITKYERVNAKSRYDGKRRTQEKLENREQKEGYRTIEEETGFWKKLPEYRAERERE